MDAVDGNAIGGLLIDVFGTEMTAARSTCATCGATRPVAELVVYRQAPGTVVRCRTCGSVLMVLVRRADVTSVDLSGLASLSQPGSAFIPAGGIQDRPACRTSTQVGNREGISMSHEQPMSMSDEPQEESMSMGQPDPEPMSMGQPDPESMSMGQPDPESMSMGQPDPESMSTDKPHEDSM
jgi:DNA-directed RNA polymerase subunit RPC12/RpoP